MTLVTGLEPPAGRLLEVFLDLEAPLGVAYERVLQYYKDFHDHDRLNLAFPRGASVVGFTLKDERELIVDQTSVLWMPALTPHRQKNRSTIYDNFALFPTAELLAEVVKDCEQTFKKSCALPTDCLRATRSALLTELLDRYFFERVVSHAPAGALATLERQILAEVVRLFASMASPGNERIAIEPKDESAAVMRAVRHIEANLFHQIYSAELAGVARTSVATLFRKFRAELALTPADYQRRRRMEEAQALLKRGDYLVGDVAQLIGYEDLSAFSKAYKAHFGMSPSAARTS